MIKANELRLNNWVLAEGNPYQIKHISPDDEWGPIELSPEILEKAGLKCDWWGHDGDKPVGSYYISGKISISDEMLVWVGEENFPHIKYVHQLQNLVHILTGTELEINLNP